LWYKIKMIIHDKKHNLRLGSRKISKTTKERIVLEDE